MNTNMTINKFYDFITMYNLIIKHCINKNRGYDIKLYYINGNLYFRITDKESQEVLHNDSLECSKEDSKVLCNLITSEFILNHAIRYAAYMPMLNDDILMYRRLSTTRETINCDGDNYFFRNTDPMKIHVLENSIFTLNIYLFDGIDEETEKLHHMAMNKANEDAKKYRKKIEL